jgi:hypothetical protein
MLDISNMTPGPSLASSAVRFLENLEQGLDGVGYGCLTCGPYLTPHDTIDTASSAGGYWHIHDGRRIATTDAACVRSNEGAQVFCSFALARGSQRPARTLLFNPPPFGLGFGICPPPAYRHAKG